MSQLRLHTLILTHLSTNESACSSSVILQPAIQSHIFDTRLELTYKESKAHAGKASLPFFPASASNASQFQSNTVIFHASVLLLIINFVITLSKQQTGRIARSRSLTRHMKIHVSVRIVTIGTFRLDYEYEIEYEYDFRISNH